MARLTQAVDEGGSVATLVQAIRDQERRQQTIRAELADLDRPRVVPLTVNDLRERLEAKADAGLSGTASPAHPGAPWPSPHVGWSDWSRCGV